CGCGQDHRVPDGHLMVGAQVHRREENSIGSFDNRVGVSPYQDCIAGATWRSGCFAHEDLVQLAQRLYRKECILRKQSPTNVLGTRFHWGTVQPLSVSENIGV